MAVFITGSGLFLLAMAIHIAWWRHRRPRRSGQILMLLLVAVIIAGWTAGLLAAAAWPGAARLMPGDMFAWVQALVLALALAAAYVMTYPAIEAESPIFVIIEAIALRGRAGITADEFHRCLDNSVLVAPRIQDLVNEGLIALENGHYRPTEKGIALVRIFIAWRRLIRADVGG